jgi:aminoglycoside phosphotransferase (APT) family kinase protein
MAGTVEITPEFGEVRQEEQLDWAKLAAYLRERLPDADRPLTVKQFRGGHSNLTYLLRFGDREWVMRRPPFGPLPVGGHDMGREYRVLSRVWEVFTPAPRGMLYCEDPAIVGSPFFVMERRKGILIRMRQALPPELPMDPASLRKLSEGFVDTLADLHAVNYQAIGLGELGKPDGFLKRQITGWMGRWEKAKTREVPLMEKLGGWFLDHMPDSPPPSLIHNDYYLHNLMIDFADPGQVVGVFDWEMSTIGDPLVDFGVALGYWREPDDPPDLLATGEGEVHTLRPGFMNRDELIHRYATRTGRDLSNMPYYWAWAHWKNATVVEQIYVRYVRGQTTDPRFAGMGTHPPALASAAARIARRLGFRD